MEHIIHYTAKQSKLVTDREIIGGLIDIVLLIKKYGFESAIDILPQLKLVAFDGFTTDGGVDICEEFTEDLFDVSDYEAITTSMNEDGSVSVRSYKEMGHRYSYEFGNISEYNLSKRRMFNHITERHSGNSVKDWNSIVKDCYIKQTKMGTVYGDGLM